MIRGQASVLDVPFIDASAAQLRLRLGPTPAESLLQREIPCGPTGRMLLEVLGSSHRVTVELGSLQLVETVACDGRGSRVAPLVDERLPLAHEAVEQGCAYRFESRVEPLGAAGGELRQALVDSGALVGVFPGHPDAFTALAADTTLAGTGGVVLWDTWHAYPSSDELVSTSTTIGLPGATET